MAEIWYGRLVSMLGGLQQMYSNVLESRRISNINTVVCRSGLIQF